jgi:hypothetical protein
MIFMRFCLLWMTVKADNWCDTSSATRRPGRGQEARRKRKRKRKKAESSRVHENRTAFLEDGERKAVVFT